MKKKFLVLFFCTLIFSGFSQEDKKNSINGFMPAEIFVTTNTQTFCKGFSFNLYNGKIWVKEDGETEWSLFLGKGVPFYQKEKNLSGNNWFEDAQYVTEISSDGDAIFAFDGNKNMYRCYLQDTTADPPFAWLNNFGWPKRQILSKTGTIEDTQAWSMSVRRKDILWYEDRYGNEHHYGTMGLETVYFLTKNGTELRFTDSGLPCSASKTILLPERGSFIAENMSSSGSTIFLINKAGKMYTRLIDYDTMGCDPMFFKYSYNPGKQKYSGENYLSNYSLWGLPNEDWKLEPEIELTGKAKLTKHISIFQNGKGNFARVLRVAGISSDGQTGFYEKNIAEEKWTFVKADLQLTEDSFLEYADANFLSKEESKNVLQNLNGKKHEFSYKGFFYLADKKNEDFIFEIPDFTLTTEGSCTLIITSVKTGQKKSLTLHPLEMWTYLVQDNPGFDGTPRNYFVTPEYDSNFFETDDEKLSEVLIKIFDGINQKLYAFNASATVEYVEIDLKDYEDAYIFLTSENTTLSPESYKKNAIFNRQVFIDGDDKVLLLEPKTYSKFDIPEILEKIKNNEDYIKQISEDFKTLQDYKKNARKSRWGYNLIDFITTITFLNKLDFPKIKTITTHGSNIMKTNAISYKTIVEYNAEIYPKVEKIIHKRIKTYENLIFTINEDGEALLEKSFISSFDDFEKE